MVAYFGIAIRDILVIAASNILGIIVFRIILLVAGLWAVYLLLIAGLVPLISNAIKKKKIKKEQALADIKNEGKIRSMAARDPAFQTYCYECKHFNHDLDYCQRKRERRPVKEIRIKDKTLCAAWEAKR
jgi:predicted membrane protein